MGALEKQVKTERLRIVLLIDWFLYYTVELANSLCEHHEVLLITRDHNCEISSDKNEMSLDLFLDESLNKKVTRVKLKYKRRDFIKSIVEVLKVVRCIREFKADVLHIQETPDWRIHLVAYLFGLNKTVLTIHDVTMHPGEENKGVQGILWNNLRKKAAQLIVHGEYLKSRFSKRYNCQEKLNVIPHGVLSIYKKWDAGDVKEEENTVLFFGRLSKYKGFDTLIAAEQLITKEITDFKIIIAGKGPESKYIRQKVSENKSFELHIGFIPNNEVYKYFRRASIVVLPYTEASQSGVIPIAYLFGKPVIVTNVGSLPEVVDDGKTGIVIPPGDPKALAQAVINIMKSNKLKSYMGEMAHKKANGDLSWSNISDLTSRVYSTLVQ